MNNRTHSNAGGFVKKVEDQLPAEQIDGKVLNVSIPGKKVGKYDGKHGHHQQGIENGPQKAQNGTAVFGFDIPAHQLADEIPVFYKYTK